MIDVKPPSIRFLNDGEGRRSVPSANAHAWICRRFGSGGPLLLVSTVHMTSLNLSLLLPPTSRAFHYVDNLIHISR